MRVVVLDWAERDLDNGRIFYDSQEEGIGEYFLDSLPADIESLALYGGVHAKVGQFHRALAHIFPYAIITPLKTM